MLEGIDATRAALEGFTTKYPDIQLSLGRVISVGQLASAEWTEVGTDAGEPVNFRFCGVLEFRDDLISGVTRYGGK